MPCIETLSNFPIISINSGVNLLRFAISEACSEIPAPFKKASKSRFLSNTFSPHELAYCFSFKDYSPHLAGTFAAKEAVHKALGTSGTPLSSLEIRRQKNGQPAVWIKGRFQKSILVSISHTKALAVAAAFRK